MEKEYTTIELDDTLITDVAETKKSSVRQVVLRDKISDSPARKKSQSKQKGSTKPVETVPESDQRVASKFSRK